jgi:hypothetical protein
MDDPDLPLYININGNDDITIKIKIIKRKNGEDPPVRINSGPRVRISPASRPPSL